MSWKPIPEYQNQFTCLSTDPEPTNYPVNSIAVELNTGKVKYWDGTEWAEFGGDA